MNAHEKNSAICGHLLVGWAIGLNAISWFLTGSLDYIFGLVFGGLALFVAHLLSGVIGTAYSAYIASGGASGWHPPSPVWYWLAAAFTFLSWLWFVVDAFIRSA